MKSKWEDLDWLEKHIFEEAKMIGARYGMRPGVTVRLDTGPPALRPEDLPPNDICWPEFDQPPVSEVANGYCYDKQYYIYGYGGPRNWGCNVWVREGPVWLERGAEYFVVELYKDRAL